MDQVLFEAARLIDEKGHCKNSFTSMGGQYCIEGAIRTVILGSLYAPLHDYDRVLEKMEKVYRVIRDIRADHDPEVWTWNDHPDRTKEEVVKVLMEAAEYE